MKNNKTHRLKELRVGMRLRPEYLANLLHCTKADYLQIEQGESTPTEKQIRMLSKVYGISKEQLFNPDKRTNTSFPDASNDLTDNDKKQYYDFLWFQKQHKK